MQHSDNLRAWSKSIDRIVAELHESCDLMEPPFDALTLAERLGFVVAVDSRQQGRGRCALLPSGVSTIPAIFLRPEPRGERRQWTVAHEIGEFFAGTVLHSLGLDGESLAAGLREQMANLIANRILLPTAHFFADGPECDWDLAELKQRYPTASHELIARRMLDGGPPAILTVFDRGRMQFRRGGSNANVSPPTPAEIDARRRAHESNRTIERRVDGMRIRVWPIHETDWKREICRTEPLETAFD